MMLFRISSFKPYLIALVTYLTLAFGGLLPIALEGINKALPKGILAFVAFCLLIYIGKFKRKYVYGITIFVLLTLAFLLFRLFDAQNIILALEKIDGIVFASALISILTLTSLDEFGYFETQKNLVQIGAVILVFTLVYKLIYGFSARDVKFLINGPIVFAWLMAICAYLSLFLWSTARLNLYIVYYFVFVLAIFWTGSRGPLLALLIVSITFIALNLRTRFSRTLLLGSLVFSILLLTLPFLMTYFEDSRILILLNKLLESDDVDASSQQRLDMLLYSYEQFMSHPFFGIGIGNFTYKDFYYPHNETVELFVELGIFYGSTSVIFIIVSIFKSNQIYRLLILMAFIMTSFSGDASYLRFLYAFCLVGILAPKFEGNREYNIISTNNNSLKNLQQT